MMTATMQISREGAVHRDDTTLQFVIFQAGVQSFAVEINRVKEILRYRKVTPLPRTPSFIEGVIDLRGVLIPVLDLRKRFEVASPVYNEHTRIIVLRYKNKKIGLVVDSVSRVLPIPLHDIKAPPAIARAHGSEYMLAVAKYQDDLYIVLDLDRILSSAERMTLEKVKLA
jgi:purine-binding chemotaxis protein CheW